MARHVHRDYLTVVRENGLPYRTDHGRQPRIRALQNGAERRRGEKIVGMVSRYQAGVHMTFGYFSDCADTIRNMREKIESGNTSKWCPENYCRNVIDRTLAEARGRVELTIREGAQQ